MFAHTVVMAQVCTHICIQTLHVQTLYTSIYIKSQFVLMNTHSIESGQFVGINQGAKATP